MALTSVTVEVTPPPASPITVDVSQAPASPITVEVSQARDAYQIARAEGFSGTPAEWLANLEGAVGTSITTILLTAAQYAALPAEEQMDATKWYLIEEDEA